MNKPGNQRDLDLGEKRFADAGADQQHVAAVRRRMQRPRQRCEQPVGTRIGDQKAEADRDH